MTQEIKTPKFAESVSEGTLLNWNVASGDYVNEGDPLAEVETDKIVVEVVAPINGKITEILVGEAETVKSEQLIAKLDDKAKAPEKKVDVEQPTKKTEIAPKSQPSVEKPAVEKIKQAEITKPATTIAPTKNLQQVGPAARNLMQAEGIDKDEVVGTGKNNRISKTDVLHSLIASSRPTERVPMTRIRQKIAERLLEVKQTTAMLTTFNEVNLQAIIDLRGKYKEQFIEEHEVKLGFMSFFVKASTEALKRFPAINAVIDGQDIVYRGYCDIGVAISTSRGLIVPIVKDAEKLSLAQIETNILDLADKAKNNQLTMDDLAGGTFSITNGGIFGSLLSTPIINHGQSAILGMHSIQKKPIVVNDEIVIRPMMYVALSYDHRIVDGKEAVSFLKFIKESLEDPMRMLLQI